MSGRNKTRKKKDAFQPGGRMYEKFKDQKKAVRRTRPTTKRKK